MKYRIRYGLGGGFGGCERNEWEEIEVDSEQQARDYAYQGACDEYEMYDGLHGLRSVKQIMEEDGVDAEEAEDIWIDERESWLDYEVESVEPAKKG